MGGGVLAKAGVPLSACGEHSLLRCVGSAQRFPISVLSVLNLCAPFYASRAYSTEEQADSASSTAKTMAIILTAFRDTITAPPAVFDIVAPRQRFVKRAYMAKRIFVAGLSVRFVNVQGTDSMGLLTKLVGGICTRYDMKMG